MSLHSIIANGGKVLVVGGMMNKAWAEYENHPQIVFWCGDRKDIQQRLRGATNGGDNFPDNTRGVIISRYISHSESGQVIAEARRKRALIMGPRNDGEITRTLAEITNKPEPPKEDTMSVAASTTPPASKTPPPLPVRYTGKGRLTRFVEDHVGADLPARKEGARLLKLAADIGLDTTLPSIEQCVRVVRSKIGVQVYVRKPAEGHKAGSYVQRRKGTKAEPEAIAKAREKGQLPATPPPAPNWALLPPNPPVVGSDNGTGLTPAAAALSSDETLLRMLDDMATTITLVREEVLRFRADRDKYAQLKATLAALAQ